MRVPKNQTMPKRRVHTISFIAAALVIFSAAAGLLFLQKNGQASAVGSTAPLPKEVSVAEAARLREEGAFILDVREPDEWAEHHIPGAVLVPVGELETRLGKLPQDREIVVVCRSGNRSAVGRDILLAAGYQDVTSMAGGMNQWRASGLDVENDQ